MPVGIIINSLSVALGGAAGAAFGHKVPEHLKTGLTSVFGVCSMGMGVTSIVLMKNMPAVIFSVVLGTAIGLLTGFGAWVNRAALALEKPAARLASGKRKNISGEDYVSLLVTAAVLFCASGTGIYGSLDAGISGDHTVLISKSVLDFFTAMIFAANLGVVTSLIAIPQCIIFLLIFLAAKAVFPLTTPDMIADFKACGGFLLVATGFRIAKIEEFPIADMIPAMVLVMPLSAFWSQWITPLF